MTLSSLFQCAALYRARYTVFEDHSHAASPAAAPQSNHNPAYNTGSMSHAPEPRTLAASHASPGRMPLRLVAAAGTLLLLGCSLPACYEPVFREDEARSQYDRFDAVRDQRAPQYYYDEYGNRKPNIRGRLLGSDT